MIEKTCCFTGHRDISKADYPLVRENLKKALVSLIEQGYLYFGAGGALGFDTLAAQAVLELKELFPQIHLILVLPCKGQTRNWEKKDVMMYDWILRQSSKVVYLAQQYTPSCMFARNRHLVDHSSVCLCYLKKKTGGTAYTVDYARRKGRGVINLAL